jgi:hypothetical protein
METYSLVSRHRRVTQNSWDSEIVAGWCPWFFLFAFEGFSTLNRVSPLWLISFYFIFYTSFITIQGLQHYRIQGHRVCYISLQHRYQQGNGDPVKDTLKEIASHGPVYGWFILNVTSFSAARHGIYRAPQAKHKSDTHAVLLYGFGARGRRTSAMCYTTTSRDGAS